MKKTDPTEKKLLIGVIVIVAILLGFSVFGEVLHNGNVLKLLLYLFGGLGLMALGTWIVARIYAKHKIGMPAGGVYAAQAQADINAREQLEKESGEQEAEK